MTVLGVLAVVAYLAIGLGLAALWLDVWTYTTFHQLEEG